MADQIDIRAILLRAEARAKERLEKTLDWSRESFNELEEAYASACAVRRYWEECEQRTNANTSESKRPICPIGICNLPSGHEGQHSQFDRR